MSLYSLDFFRNWDFDCEYDPKGYLFFATTDEQLNYLRRNVEVQRSLGVTDVELVDADAVERFVPGMICDDIKGASFGRHDGFINPLAVMHGFTKRAVRGGAKIEFGIDAKGLRVVAGRICGVETSNGLIECDAAVICTGARAAGLARTAGLDLPVTPQRRQIVWARTRGALPANMPMVIDIGTGFHFRPARDFRAKPPKGGSLNNEILFAYPDPEEPSSVRTEFDDGFVAKVYERAKCRAKFLFEAECVREKCSGRPLREHSRPPRDPGRMRGRRALFRQRIFRARRDAFARDRTCIERDHDRWPCIVPGCFLFIN
jgi:sarcosine oxidase subunit beta